MEEKNQLPHPERVPVWPSFAFFNDKIDGRFPVSRVESWSQFIENLRKEASDPTGAEIIYRGHRRFDWELDSTLSRRFDGGSIPSEISNSLMKKFKLAMRGRGTDVSIIEENEAWAFGQHFGLATPLLDWTESPLVALFFAFSEKDPENEKPDIHPEKGQPNKTRVVFRLNRSLIEGLKPGLFYEPSLGENSRLVNQAGLFTVTPDGNDNFISTVLNQLSEAGAVDLDDANKVAKYVCKIHIKNEGKNECLDDLRKMNIHHGSLFPDPTGASLFCNDWLDRKIKKKSIKVPITRPTNEEKTKNDIMASSKKYKNVWSGVAKILRDSLSKTEKGTFSPIMKISKEWSEKIDQKYRDTEAVDWTKSRRKRIAVKTTLKRQLKMFGFPPHKIDATADLIVNLYASRYDEKHGITHISDPAASP